MSGIGHALPDQVQLNKYFDVVFEIGLKLMPGQWLHITANVSDRPVVLLAVEHAYAFGAGNVTVEWLDNTVDAMRLRQADEQTATAYPAWKTAMYEEMLDAGACFLRLDSPFADPMKDVSLERIKKMEQNRSRGTAHYNQLKFEFKVRYCIATVANADWAARVFPELPGEQALASLWQAIFHCCYADLDDPIGYWLEKRKKGNARAEMLMNTQFDALRFCDGRTDLTVGLPRGHHWVCGCARSPEGVEYLPNMPSEECATAPDRNHVDGIVYSTRPLIYKDMRIEDFWLRFVNGRVVEYDARVGRDTLEMILTADENSSYIGEVAMVDGSAVIGKTGLVFYTTLFDENASCHIALGECVPMLVDGMVGKSRQEQLAGGVNRSCVHVDFMVGSDTMNIYGIKNGVQTQLFRNGRWAD